MSNSCPANICPSYISVTRDLQWLRQFFLIRASFIVCDCIEAGLGCPCVLGCKGSLNCEISGPVVPCAQSRIHAAASVHSEEGAWFSAARVASI